LPYWVGTTAIKLSDAEGLYPGIHLHALKSIGKTQKWQLGLGYENVLTEKIHHTFNIPIGYNLFDKLMLIAGPGLSFEKHQGANEFGLNGHIEAVYEFEFKHFHLGPMIGFGFDREHSHFGIGIHLGFGH
jgi:hypothetical protein